MVLELLEQNCKHDNMLAAVAWEVVGNDFPFLPFLSFFFCCFWPTFLTYFSSFLSNFYSQLNDSTNTSRAPTTAMRRNPSRATPTPASTPHSSSPSIARFPRKMLPTTTTPPTAVTAPPTAATVKPASLYGTTRTCCRYGAISILHSIESAP